MKKISLILTMMYFVGMLMAQTVTLTFTGQDADNSYCQLDRVIITNLTKDWESTILWPDTTLTMHVGTGIDDYVSENEFILFQNNPNPFNGTTEARLTLPESGEVLMQIVDINGRLIAEKTNFLQAGSNLFRIQISNAGVYFLTAQQNNLISTIKMVNNGTGVVNSVEYLGVGSIVQATTLTINSNAKGEEKGSTIYPFSFGDEMKYIGYAIINGMEIESQHIQQMQGASQTFTLQFKNLPTVITSQPSNVMPTCATCGGNVTSDGGADVIDRGICYNTTGTPTISDNCVHIGTGTGSFAQNVTGLNVSTTYYLRAYAINSVGVAYGDIESFTTLPAASDGEPCTNAATVTDYDGNVYNTVQIGQQCWMRQNLKTTHYANGTSIALGSSTSTTTPYRYRPDNNSGNVSTRGYLYNWKAVMGNSSASSSNPSGVQGICPTGWHVPSSAEWSQLKSYVRSQSQYVCDSVSNNIAKALASTTGWSNSTGTCTIGNTQSNNNATGFSAVSAGEYYGDYQFFSYYAFFWSCTVYSDSPTVWKLSYSNAKFLNSTESKKNALSVRCLMN